MASNSSEIEHTLHELSENNQESAPLRKVAKKILSWRHPDKARSESKESAASEPGPNGEDLGWILKQAEVGNIEYLLGFLRDRGNKSFRWHAVWELGRLASPPAEVFDALLLIASNATEDTFVRMQAIASVGQIGQGRENVIASLADLVATFPDKYYVLDALWIALGLGHSVRSA